MAATPYPAYGCDMPAGWLCRMAATPYPAYGYRAAETA
ncbi:Hypothetical protein ABZS17G119_03327 [Kosakonia cowanii]